MAQANPLAAASNIYRTPELWQKITFTFLCLVIYRVGSHVTAPGVDVTAMCIVAIVSAGYYQWLAIWAPWYRWSAAHLWHVVCEANRPAHAPSG